MEEKFWLLIWRYFFGPLEKLAKSKLFQKIFFSWVIIYSIIVFIVLTKILFSYEF